MHVIQDFPQPVEEIFAHLSEQENLEPLFGAKIKRLSDGSDGMRNGAAASRQSRVGPLPSFVETNTEVIPARNRRKVESGPMRKAIAVGSALAAAVSAVFAAAALSCTGLAESPVDLGIALVHLDPDVQRGDLVA